MKFYYNNIYSRTLYIHFVYLFLLIFFFSTVKLHANSFEIRDVEISKSFEINFNKNEIIDEGFKKAFFELISLITISEDQKKIENVRLNKIKGMIESFSIKEEKFINDVYFVNVGVSFNKKKIYNFLEESNIFPSVPALRKILLIPIIIDENKKDLLVFYKNKFYDEWNLNIEKNELINYLLPTEDLEDLNTIKNKYEIIEEYNFNEITDKYFLKDSIIVLIFKNENGLRILSKITIKDKVKILNQTYPNTNLEDVESVKMIIKNLKTIYEDHWKLSNQINTSIKLPVSIKVESFNNSKIAIFEKILDESDLIYNFNISKFDKDFIFYEIIFNGTTENFLKLISDNGYSLNTQNKTWTLK